MAYLSIQLEKVVELPVVGDFILGFSDNFMNPSGISNVKWVLTGLILISVIVFEPRGLNGIWPRIRRYWNLWPF